MKRSASLLAACFLVLSCATAQEVLSLSESLLASKADKTLAKLKHQRQQGPKRRRDNAHNINTSKSYIFGDNEPLAEGMGESISEFLALNSRAKRIDQVFKVMNRDYGRLNALGDPLSDSTGILNRSSLSVAAILPRLSLANFFGFLVIIGITTGMGLTVYFVSYKLIKGYPTQEMKDVANNLFRVVGVLVSLFLSLTFADVMVDLNTIESAIERQAIGLLNVYYDLQRFGVEETRSLQVLLRDYAQTVIEEDWPALADDRLSKRGGVLGRQLEDAVLNLEATNSTQKTLQSRMLADVDKIFDYRLSLLQQTEEKPPFFMIVVVFGFLLTMVCFGFYPPSRTFIALMSLYTVLVGLSIFLILTLSDPFQGFPGMSPAPFEEVLEYMQSENELQERGN